ncbi:MFS transporter [Sphingomonas sp. AP4-R1]|nr:MFS transporter [Sphingomonas sp. AP4-R1]QJU59117.1 MFS transporter [Sphingomonas sp. AP4-R1]
MIGRRERWSYAAGDLGFNFIWQSTEFYLLFFYVRHLGLSPPVASAVFLAGGLVEWIADPLIGVIADRASRHIPLRYWVAVGGPIAAALLAATFSMPPLAGGSTIALVLITYCLLRIAYSVGNIPYGALTARISPLRGDQLALSSVRMQGAATGGLIAASVYVALAGSGAEGEGFGHGALLLAILSVPAFLLAAFGVRERVRPGADAGRPPLSSPTGDAPSARIAFARLLRASPQLRRLLATILVSGTTITVLDKSLLFTFEEFGVARMGVYLALFPPLALLVSAPIWAALGARLGRSPVLVAAVILQTGAIAAALLSSTLYPVLIATAVAIVAGEGASVMLWSLAPEAVSECEALDANGRGYAVQVYALVNLARKSAQVLAPQAIAITLMIPHASVRWATAAIAATAVLVVLAYAPTKR